MTPDVERFLAEIRERPEFRAAAARGPEAAAGFATLEGGLRALYSAGADDSSKLELFDDVRRVVARDDLTIKQQLQAIIKIFERSRVGQQ